MSPSAGTGDALAALAAELDDGAALIERIDGPFRRGIRLHPRRGRPHGWGPLAAVPWNEAGCFHDSGIDPGTRLDYHSGLAWPQDAASQLPVRLLQPRPGEVVVDCCAAPGSKSTQIGIALGDEGLLLCLDASRPRRRVLAETLARQGVASALVCPMSVRDLGTRRPGCADAVLIDAPCSGHARRSAKQVARMAERQLRLLEHAAALCTAGGRLVYSTCAPYREENEGVVERFLAANGRWQVESATLPGCDRDLAGLGGCRLWPQRHGTEPFFAIRLRAPDDAPFSALTGELPAAARAALPSCGSDWQRWRRGALLLAGSRACASCALPSEARGIVLGRFTGDTLRLEHWGAQALIERGAAAETVSHEQACRLWAGAQCSVAARGELLRSEHGAPLGVGDGGGLRLPSRLRRDGLC